MPPVRDVAHMRLHIQPVIDEFPNDRNIRERGGEIIRALDVAPTNSQDILDYLDAQMILVANPDTAKVRTWIVEVRQPDSTEGHLNVDMGTLLEVDTLG